MKTEQNRMYVLNALSRNDVDAQIMLRTILTNVCHCRVLDVRRMPKSKRLICCFVIERTQTKSRLNKLRIRQQTLWKKYN